MKNDEAIDLLTSIDRVEPPPFLFTRIEARLQQRHSVSRNWVLASVVGACAIVALNVMVLRGQSSAHAEDLASLVSGMGIDSSNQLYR